MTRRRLPVLDDLSPQARNLLGACLAAESDDETHKLLAQAIQVCPRTVREMVALLGAWRTMRERERSEGA